MRNRSQKGFTLIELLIVIAIIGILAAVLIPNLLNARARAFDSGAQTCLKELGTQMEVVASNAPFEYDLTDFTLTNAAGGGAEFDGDDILACDDVRVSGTVGPNDDSFAFRAHHDRGTTEYIIRNGTGVLPEANDPGGDAPDPADTTP